MIAQPTTTQLIEAARHDLEVRVAPFVEDPGAQTALAMSIAVLGSALVRSEHELAWMLEEADAIEALARELTERLQPASALPEALADLERGKGPAHDMAGVHAYYERASELLSRAAEAAYAAGDERAIREVTALFEERRRHQDTVTGGYQAVGRAEST
jgi:hypothetical protein